MHDSKEPEAQERIHLEHIVHDAQESEAEGGAVLVNVNTGANLGLKLGKDGHTVLLPQPSDDPQDPLNWSWTRKHGMLLVVMLGSFSCDFAAATQATVALQGAEWHMSADSVNKANSLNVLMIGVGGLLWVPVCRFWGRAPVLFWCNVLGLAFVAGATFCQNFDTFYAMRGLMTTFQSAYLTIGLFVITDVFYFHEHARKIGFWVTSILLAPVLCPVLANLIVYYTNEWRPVWWMVLPVTVAALVMVPLLGDETWYDRSIPISQQPERGRRILRILGVWQIRHHGYFSGLWPSIVHSFGIATKPLVVIAFLYYLMAYMWFIGTTIAAPVLLQTPREVGGYGFSNKVVALISLAPLFGVLFGETFGHFFNDWIADRYIRRHHGVFVPEARLLSNYLAHLLMIPGLIIVGFTLQKHLHWAGIVVGWGAYSLGACVTSVALFAYVADSYPTSTGEISAILNLARCAGGFSVGYFELQWGVKSGYEVSFGVEAAIVAASVGWLVIFSLFGRKLRVWGGPVPTH